MAFPSNQFGAQEPKSNDEIRSFVQRTFGAQFPLFAKTDVQGPKAHPLFAWLTRRLGGGDVRWNFEKFLINRRGQPVARYRTATAPKDLEAEIVRLLEEPAPRPS